jgi:dihydroorotate dehydrogenase (fumarate)
VDNILRRAEFGAGGVVIPSVFEEQIEHEEQMIERLVAVGADSYPEALTYFPPAPASYRVPLGRYLEMLNQAVNAVDIPVIASLNGTTAHGWVNYAKQMQQAGAHALELNIYFIPAAAEMSGREVEHRYIDILKAVKKAVSIPVAVKLGPYFSSMHHMARMLVDAGADGLVLFNRFYQPDIDLARLTMLPNVELSTAAEIRLPLLWIGVLSGRISASLAASTGVENANEVIKYLLAGADAVMTASALVRRGAGHMKTLLDGLKNWLEARDLETLEGIRGRMSQHNIQDPTVFERANYIRVLQSYQPNW